MRYCILTAAVSLLFSAACALYAADNGTAKLPANPLQAVSSGPVVAQFKEVYVYCDDQSKNRYFPTGWMGDATDIKFSVSYHADQNQDLGKTCLKITYLAKGKNEWAGVYWQNPANNWGSINGGRDLTGAKFLTFWARGEKGGEIISEFKIGGLTGKYPDSDMAWMGPVKLKKDWQQYKIDLKDKDLHYILGGFCFTVLASDNPPGCTFYLADIKYE